MAMDRKLYPANWDAIALAIKEEVGWACEGCSKKCRRRGEKLSDFMWRYCEGQLHTRDWVEVVDHPKKFELGVAHLNHVPGNCDRSNLKALCAPCHARMDLRAMPTKKRLKRERNGQTVLNI